MKIIHLCVAVLLAVYCASVLLRLLAQLYVQLSRCGCRWAPLVQIMTKLQQSKQTMVLQVIKLTEHKLLLLLCDLSIQTR